MSAFDVVSRGLAVRALTAQERGDTGVASMRCRSAPTGAALVELAAARPAIECYPGDVHVVDYAPYVRTDDFVLRGNGAELRSESGWLLTESDIVGVALPLGSSNAVATGNLTFHPVDPGASSGMTLDLGANAGAFAEGDLVVLRGESGYGIVVNGEAEEIPRWSLRARVIAVEGPAVTLDRVPPAELMADGPRMGNTAEGVYCGFEDGPDAFYLLYNPRVTDITLSSDFGEAWKWGGVIDGRFRDVTVVGRNGVVFNAMQDCLFDGIRIQAWRKLAELGEGSAGTVLRNLRGTLASAVGKMGNGVDDHAPFFVGIAENCRDCTFDDLLLDSGPNTASIAAVVLGSGTGNRIVRSTLYFPQHEGLGVLMSSHPQAGNAMVDCGIADTTIVLPHARMFFNIADGGAGMVRPFLCDVSFRGACSTAAATGGGTRAGTISGSDGVLRNVRCEDGGLYFDGACTGWDISGCYFPDGFENLGPALLANNRIRDNDSDANRAARGAAVAERSLGSTNATAANSIYSSATFPPGSLAAGDRVVIAVDATSGSAAPRTARVSVGHGPAPTVSGLAANVRGSAGAMFVDGEIAVLSDTVVTYRLNLWGTVQESFIAVSSIAANGLTVNVELWTGNSADAIGVRGVRIVPVKPGMMHLPLK